MSHGDRRKVGSDYSDHLVIKSVENSDSESLVLEPLLLKKEPNGYTIEKGRKIRRPVQNDITHDRQKAKPSKQPLLYDYVLPVTSTQPLKHESSEFDLNYLTCSPTCCWVQNNLEVSASSNLTVDEDYRNFPLDTVYADRALGGCSLIKKDCFLAEKTQNLSGLDGFQFQEQNTKFPENTDNIAEPILERLFSQVSDASQASTKTAHSDDSEFPDNTDCEDEDAEYNINILEDGSIPVISKSDSNVHIVGSF